MDMKEGIIISGVSSFYDVWTNEGTVRCKARGSFRKLGITPVIGDRVLFSEKLYLERVLPRTSLLVRPPVANADQAVLVIAAHTPEPNLALLDRFLAQTLEQFIEFFGPERPCSVAREISKVHEEHKRGTLDQVAQWFREHEPKGEIVIVVGGAPPEKAQKKKRYAPPEEESE